VVISQAVSRAMGATHRSSCTRYWSLIAHNFQESIVCEDGMALHCATPSSAS
jgi:hypothetical protein